MRDRAAAPGSESAVSGPHSVSGSDQGSVQSHIPVENPIHDSIPDPAPAPFLDGARLAQVPVNGPIPVPALVRTPRSQRAPEVRCAVRFPLALSVTLECGEEEIPALTLNISASGILFALDRRLNAGAEIRYSVRMPGAVLGTAKDVLVHCTGRVVRCSLSQNQYLAAATIDDYRLAEH